MIKRARSEPPEDGHLSTLRARQRLSVCRYTAAAAGNTLRRDPAARFWRRVRGGDIKVCGRPRFLIRSASGDVALEPEVGLAAVAAPAHHSQTIGSPPAHARSPPGAQLRDRGEMCAARKTARGLAVGPPLSAPGWASLRFGRQGSAGEASW